jgi:hypothetical protein
MPIGKNIDNVIVIGQIISKKYTNVYTVEQN